MTVSPEPASAADSVPGDESLAGGAPEGAVEELVTEPSVRPGEEVAVTEPEAQPEGAEPSGIAGDVVAATSQEEVVSPPPSAPQAVDASETPAEDVTGQGEEGASHTPEYSRDPK